MTTAGTGPDPYAVSVPAPARVAVALTVTGGGGATNGWYHGGMFRLNAAKVRSQVGPGLILGSVAFGPRIPAFADSVPAPARVAVPLTTGADAV